MVRKPEEEEIAMAQWQDCSGSVPVWYDVQWQELTVTLGSARKQQVVIPVPFTMSTESHVSTNILSLLAREKKGHRYMIASYVKKYTQLFSKIHWSMILSSGVLP